MKQSLTDIPSEWQKARIKDISVAIQSGGSLGLTKIKDYQTTGFPAYSAAGQDGFVKQYEYEVSGVVVSSIGARCGKCFYATGQWTTLANTQVIFSNEKVYSSKFLWYLINDESYWHRSGTAQPFIKPSDIQNAWIPQPPLAEQQAIVTALDTLAQPIATHQQILEQTTLLKEGLLQQLKNGQLFNKNTPKYRLKQLASLRMGETLIAKNLSGTGIPVYSADTGTKPWGYTNNAKNQFSSGTIIISARGSIGYPRLPPQPAYISTQTTIAVQPNQDMILPAYLHCWLQTLDYDRLKAVQAIPMLTVGDMKEVFVFVPSKAQQQKIAVLFSAIETITNTHLEQIESHKRLLEEQSYNLLYGKTRIAP